MHVEWGKYRQAFLSLSSITKWNKSSELNQKNRCYIIHLLVYLTAIITLKLWFYIIEYQMERIIQLHDCLLSISKSKKPNTQNRCMVEKGCYSLHTIRMRRLYNNLILLEKHLKTNKCEEVKWGLRSLKHLNWSTLYLYWIVTLI